MPPTVFQPSPRRTALIVLGAVAFVAVGVWLLLTGESVKALVGGGLAVAFFGYCAVLGTVRLVRREPELVVSDDGLSHVVHGEVSWDDVDHVALSGLRVSGATQYFVEVVLRDPDAYRPRRRMLTGSVAGLSPYAISVVGLSESLEDVLAAMVRHHPGLAVANP
jgi:hypothetical protein